MEKRSAFFPFIYAPVSGKRTRTVSLSPPYSAPISPPMRSARSRAIESEPVALRLIPPCRTGRTGGPTRSASGRAVFVVPPVPSGRNVSARSPSAWSAFERMLSKMRPSAPGSTGGKLAPAAPHGRLQPARPETRRTREEAFLKHAGLRRSAAARAHRRRQEQ